MDIKVNNGTRAGDVQKSKKSSRSESAEGSKFADMLEETGAFAPVESTPGFGGFGGGNAFIPGLDDEADDVPADPEARSAWMLARLDELQRDILSGDPSQAAGKLKRALESGMIDRASLPTALKTLVDEIDLRASIELAKLDAGKKR